MHNQEGQHVPVQPLILPPASQSQRTRVQRDNEIAELRKFKTNFVLVPSPKDQRRSVRHSGQHVNAFPALASRHTHSSQLQIRSTQDQAAQHQNAAPMDMRQQSNDDNQKPYQGQVKSYPAHPMKYSSQLQSSTDSVSSSSPASVEGDKRSMPSMGQQVKPGAPLPPTNLSQNQTPEAKPADQPPQAYVSRIERTQQPARDHFCRVFNRDQFCNYDEKQQTPTQMQPQSQNQTPQQQQQTPQPQPPQQMAQKGTCGLIHGQKRRPTPITLSLACI